MFSLDRIALGSVKMGQSLWSASSIEASVGTGEWKFFRKEGWGIKILHAHLEGVGGWVQNLKWMVQAVLTKEVIYDIGPLPGKPPYGWYYPMERFVTRLLCN